MKQVIPSQIEDRAIILEEELSKLFYHLESFTNDEIVEELMRDHNSTWIAINFVQRSVKTMIDDLNE